MSQVLLPRVSLTAVVGCDGRDPVTVTVTVAAVVARLGDRGRRPFDVPAGTPRPPVVAAAAACPDLFLIDVPPAPGSDWVARVAAAAADDGQRVLVLTAAADRVTEMLAGAGGWAVGRALGDGEPVDQCPPPVAERTATALAARDRNARRREFADRLAAAEWWERSLADEDDVRRQLDRVSESATERVERSDWYRDAVAARDAAVAARRTHQEQRAEAEREVEQLRGQLAQPAGGFLKRLFGGAVKPGDGQNKFDAAEAKLRHLSEAEPADPEPAFAAERERRVAAEVAAVRAELDDRLDRTIRDRQARVEPADPADRLRAALRDLDHAPPALSAEAKERVRVVVGPLSAVDADPLLAASHPEAAPRFDRVIVADADALPEEAVQVLDRLSPAWVLFGSADPIRPPAYRNGTYPSKPRASLFGQFWAAVREPAWEVEGDRLLARLVPVPADVRHLLTCEPLVGRPEVEVRYADAGGQLTLAEVAFPTGLSAADAKAFLAAEAGEVRFDTVGPAVWAESADAITCRWPGCDTAVTHAADLGDGVTERFTADTGHTAAVSFATAAGWTRHTADPWLAARTAAGRRTAVVR